MVTSDAIVPGASAVAEAKAYLRVDGDAEDALIGGLLASAIAVCEAFTGEILLTREFAETLANSRAWQRLGRTPVRQIDAVADGSGAALEASAYAVDIDADGDGWLRSSADGGDVRVSYRAGIADDWDAIPQAIGHGVVRLAAHLYSGRDEPTGAPPASVAALWRPFRRMRLT